jgi:hypothetical protein
MVMHICYGCIQYKPMYRDIDPCEFIKADEMTSCPCTTCLVKVMCKEYCSMYYGALEYYGLRDYDMDDDDEY